MGIDIQTPVVNLKKAERPQIKKVDFSPLKKVDFSSIDKVELKPLKTAYPNPAVKPVKFVDRLKQLIKK